MAKEKGLYETLEFNNVAYAQDVVRETEEKLEKIKLPLMISRIATLLTIISICVMTNLPGLALFLIIAAVVGAFYCYIVAGGFGKALHTAFKVATFGWFFFPFPTDLVVGATIMMFTIPAFFCMPVFFIKVQRKQLKKDLEAAQKYLSYCKTA